MSKPYDFVVIGAGSAGLLAAALADRRGVRVALTERDRPGGDCRFTDCVPSKALLHNAKAAHQARQAAKDIDQRAVADLLEAMASTLSDLDLRRAFEDSEPMRRARAGVRSG